MGRGKHCTAERRDLIKKLVSAGKTYIEVQNIIGCSSTMVSQQMKRVVDSNYWTKDQWIA